MSSLEIVLQNEETKGLSEFTFTWSIHNFSHCKVEENDFLVSPDFVIGFLGDTKFWLRVHPKGKNARGFISCYLRNRGSLRDLNVKFKLAIRGSNEQLKEGEEKFFDHNNSDSNGCPNLLSLGELKGPSGYLVNDMLTLRVHVWKTDADNPVSLKCYVHSTIEVSKLDYMWILEDCTVSNHAIEFKFNQTANITEYFFDKTPTIKIHISNGGPLGEDAIYFEIKMNKLKENYFLVCQIHVLGADGKVAHSVHGEHLFKHVKPTEVWNFPIISKNKLYLNKNAYLPRGELTLQCKLVLSSGNKLKTFEYRTMKDPELQPVTFDQEPCGQKLWAEKMRQFYTDGKFSDFIIRTPDKQFPVHRALLSAQSDVFTAMFERDMKEQKNGVVEIEDLDNDTISKMLLFLYIHAIDDIDCSSAQKLFYAADKYGIAALQKQCSSYLVQCLDASNVCDILNLADKHQDQELKAHARDFIDVHAPEIVLSEKWKKLIVINGNLTSEIFQWMFCKKFLDQKE